ncbi:G-type lectin S-receptor-like serine/threonine-protein kinase [Corchorus olitorius]|uniref:G-type lectin S-receptor-like serine/threonine-protein kinase n=1 Tax=Corchorus olitorius TaxID=93759 RepID=A0A1R3K1L9_9ROSI|nr:G-type lectin S-receptor-like serine/threonine-protein kinase [Corchorus olitorius]
MNLRFETYVGLWTVALFVGRVVYKAREEALVNTRALALTKISELGSLTIKESEKYRIGK